MLKIGMILNKYVGEFQVIVLGLSLKSQQKKDSRKRISNYKTHYNQSKPLTISSTCMTFIVCVRYDEEKHNWKRKIVAILVAHLFFHRGNVAIVVKCLFS